MCREAQQRQACITPPQDLIARARYEHCEVQMHADGCYDLAKENPSLLQGKLKNCSLVQYCHFPVDADDFADACSTAFKQSWSDMVTGVYDFLFKNKSLSATIQAREEYLETCTSVECKYEMLGSFATLFTKEEIEGVADKKSLKGDLTQQNALQGLSAKTLYRKLLLKLKEQVEKGQMQDNFIEPWSGQAARLPKNFNEMIDSMLAKMGVTHTECFTPLVLAEMRCYAFFAVLDPTLVAGAALKIASVTGRTVRAEHALAGIAKTEKATPDIPMVFNDELVRKMKQVTTIAKRKKFDADPYVETVSYKIAASRSGVSYRDKTVALNAETKMEGDRFTVKINSVEANPGWKSRYLGMTVAGREAGLNSTMAKTFYTTVKGAAMAAKANPEIKVIRIHADQVINSSLKKNLTEMGFVSLGTKRPLLDKQIRGYSAQTLVLELPVEKLAELGF